MNSPSIAQPFFRPESEELRFLPEGPLALGPDRAAWVAIQHGPDAQQGSVNLLDLRTGENRSIFMPARPGFVAHAPGDHRLVVGLDQELAILDLEADPPNVAPLGLWVADDGDTLINDGIGAPFGVVFGTKDPNFKAPIAGLYLYRRRDRRVIKLADGKTCSNGKALVREADRWHLYSVDTHTRTVARYRLDVEEGKVSDQEIWLDLTHEAHFPDGMRLSPDGSSVVIAFYHPGDITDGLVRQVRLADAAIEREWLVPGSPRVTCPSFVDLGGRTKLLITTAVEGMPDDQRARCPEAGTLFLADFD